MLKTLLYRPVWLPMTITAILLMISLILMNTTALRGLERLNPIQVHLTEFTEVQGVLLQVQSTLLNHISEGDDISPQELSGIHQQIGDIIESNQTNNTLEVSTALKQAYDILEKEIRPIPALTVVLTELNTVLDHETQIHNALLADTRKAAQLEIGITSTTLIVLPLLGIALLFFVRKRILSPLNELSWLMSQLSHHDYAPAPSNNVDPLLKPLIKNYNAMVERMAELEQEHTSRQESLELQIHNAAGHLLDQQRTLANTERLAAVGELAARLAHELRNPLAGIQMALINLQEEISNSEHVMRIELVSRELDRINLLLNKLLDQSRQCPEQISEVSLAYVTDEIFTLARYQLPKHILLHNKITPDLHWLLPENELRRTLLNLILNAYQATSSQRGTICITGYQEQESLILEVCDDGPGFPQSLLINGIRTFKTTRAEGTGLGLVAVQRFVNELQGKLQLRNIAPHGACVRLIIPMLGVHHD